jgi:hypothetical protein
VSRDRLLSVIEIGKLHGKIDSLGSSGLGEAPEGQSRDFESKIFTVDSSSGASRGFLMC